MTTAAGSQESASEQERREPIGAAGRPAQRPAEIEQRIVNKPLQIFIQGKYPVKNFYRVSHKLEQPTAGTIFLNPKEVNF